jgi:outer membrane protein
MKLRNVLIVSMGFLLAIPLWAQARPAAKSATADAPTRIAVIYLQQAIGSTGAGQQAAQEIQTRFAPRVNELTNLSKQLQSLQQRLQNGQNTLSDAEKQRLSLEYQELGRRYQRKQQQLQEDDQDAKTNAIDEIGQKMMPLISKYAREHGYSVVLDASSQTTPVLYSSNAINITAAITKLYDETFPMKSAAANPKPKP